jgi:hypothetical protein
MIPRGLNAQRDFSAGEVMEMAERRDDTDIIRNGCKRLLNAEIIQTGSAKRRPGMKRKIASSTDPIAKLTPVPGITFDIQFRTLSIYFDNNANGTRQIVSGAPWASTDLFNLSWAEINKQLFVAGPGLRTQVFTYDEDTGNWSRANFSFMSGLNGEQRMPFYRFTEPGVTILLDGPRERKRRHFHVLATHRQGGPRRNLSALRQLAMPDHRETFLDQSSRHGQGNPVSHPSGDHKPWQRWAQNRRCGGRYGFFCQGTSCGHDSDDCRCVSVQCHVGVCGR